MTTSTPPQNGLNTYKIFPSLVEGGSLPVKPRRKDLHFLKSYGATTFDTKSLPANFSIYDGRPIPNQNFIDMRFTPNIKPLPYGCTGESGTFACGLEDGLLYNPEYTYIMTPPGTEDVGRDIRDMLLSLKTVGLMDDHGRLGYKRTNYFNVYAAGAIDYFDAARIALWINQVEKRSVIVGSFFYVEFEDPFTDGRLPSPTFNARNATRHCWLVTGWKDFNGEPHLEALMWLGEDYGTMGRVYISRSIYNALLKQYGTGAFTVTKVVGMQPVTIGMRVYIDELVAYVRHLFNV